MENIKPIIDVRLRLGAGILLLVFGGGLIIIYCLIPDWREHLKFIGAVIGSMAAIFSAYYLAESIRLKLIHDFKQKEKDKRASSLKFSFADDPNMGPIILRLHENLNINARNHGEITLGELEKFPNDSYKEFHSDITLILGRLEVMSIAIKRELVCEKTCQDLLLSRLVLYYELFKQYIKKRQKEVGPDIYENLERTAIEWQKKRHDLYSIGNGD